MSLNTTIKYLSAIDITNVYDITLLHLSEKNSDIEIMYEMVAKETGKPIRIAKKGLEFEITNKPY